MAENPHPGSLVIVGAGGFGRECLDIVEALVAGGAAYEFLGFTDDGGGDTALLTRRGARCLGPIAESTRLARYFVIAIGHGATRRTIDESLTAQGMQSPVLVHPHATIGSDCRVSPGTILNAGARVTTNISLGRHVQVHANATVGHDAELADYVSVFPGATVSGSVQLSTGVTVGTGANVLPGVTIGAHAFVGAGSVVIHDVEPGATVAGVPAKPINRQP